jgi:hypothetical protein
MPLLTTNGAAILTPDQVQDLVIKPQLSSAVSTRVSTIVQTASHSTRFPIVVTDPTTAWTAEGDPDKYGIPARPDTSQTRGGMTPKPARTRS